MLVFITSLGRIKWALIGNKSVYKHIHSSLENLLYIIQTETQMQYLTNIGMPLMVRGTQVFKDELNLEPAL